MKQKVRLKHLSKCVQQTSLSSHIVFNVLNTRSFITVKEVKYALPTHGYYSKRGRNSKIRTWKSQTKRSMRKIRRSSFTAYQKPRNKVWWVIFRKRHRDQHKEKQLNRSIWIRKNNSRQRRGLVPAVTCTWCRVIISFTDDAIFIKVSLSNVIFGCCNKHDIQGLYL